MKKFLIIIISIYYSATVYTQHNLKLSCGFDVADQQKSQIDRSYLFKNYKNDLHWYQRESSDQVEQSQGTITLPIVFHIIHQNGSENISNNQVQRALDHLNQSFANTGYYDPNTGVNTEIQFCLAQRDPEGKSTSGITRSVSELTNMDADLDDQTMKDLSRWDPNSYINVYIVKEICRGSNCGVAGYAYLPGAHGREFDGIVLEADYVGSSTSRTTVLTHEMGHYLGLFHTFEGGCINDDCNQNGDKVCDTPPDNTTAYTACEGSINSCASDEDDTSDNNPFRPVSLGGLGDQEDLFENYMDYSQLKCYNQFTEGQKERMHFFINNVRQSLLNNLSCQTPCPDKVVALITNSIFEFDLGNSISLNNASSNANMYKWYVNDTIFSTEVEPSYTFVQEGYYTIVLEAISEDTIRCSNDYDTIEVIVTCPTIADFDKTTNDFTVSAQNTSQDYNKSYWSLRNQNGQELYSSNSIDFNYELSKAGWYQLCLELEGEKCGDRRCEYFFLEGDKSESRCDVSSNIRFTSNGASFNDIKIIKSSDNSIYLAGIINNSYFLSKLTNFGKIIWKKRLDVFTNYIGDLTLKTIFEDDDGNILLSGEIRERHNALIKFDPFDIHIIWSQVIEDSELRGFNTIESNDDLNYVITGQNKGCDEATLFLLNKSTGDIHDQYGYSLGECTTFTDGIRDSTAIIVTGRYSLGFGFDTYRPGITKIDFAGNILWSYTYLKDNNTNAFLYSHGICKAPNGFLTVGHGDFNGTNRDKNKGIIININNDGEMQWSKTYEIGNNAKFQRYRQAILHSSGYYLIGEFTNQVSNSTDISILNIDFSGEVNWARSLDYKSSNERTLHNNNAVLLSNDTLLLTVSSDKNVIWTKFPPDGEFDKNCDLISKIDVDVNLINNFRADYSPDIVQRNFPTSFDNSSLENFSLEQEFICGLPDITLRIDSSWCTSISGYIAEARIEVCNRGIAPVSDDIPIAIYDSNPTNSDAQLILLDTLPLNLAVDECKSLTLPVLPRDKTSGTFYIVINDDNSLSPSYDLSDDFPVTEIDECLFQNNLDSFSFHYTMKSIDLGPDISTCNNSPFVFNAGNGFESYRWNNASTDSTITAAREGLFWVVAKDECGIPYSDTVQLSYQTPTQIDLGNDTSICLGTSVELVPNNSFSGYNWFPSDIIDCDTCSTVSITPDTTTTVILTVESDPGCFSSDSLRIEVLSSHQIKDSATLCKGDTIIYHGQVITDAGKFNYSIGNCDTVFQLIVQYKRVSNQTVDLGQDIFNCDDTTISFKAPSGFVSYQWSNNSTDSIITISQAGEYWVIARDRCGAMYSDTVQLIYNNIPEIDFEDNVTICEGEDFSLIGPEGYNTYYWSPDDVECRICQNTRITPDSTITVSLFAQTDSSCISSDSITINVNYRNEISDTLFFCKGDSIYYHNRFIDEPGVYKFRIGNYCDTTLILQLYETDLSSILNNVDLSFTNGLQDLSGQTYDINLNLDPANWDVQWFPGQFYSCSNCLSTSILPFSDDRVLSVKLTHKSGCVYYKEFLVSWEDIDIIYIPNIFTPNGDGTNDNWVINPTYLIDHIKNLRIYSRWGELIKEWRNVQQISWDGTLKGKALNPAVFVYVIEYQTITGETNSIEGTFSLVR